jgi:hypothetical protein
VGHRIPLVTLEVWCNGCGRIEKDTTFYPKTEEDLFKVFRDRGWWVYANAILSYCPICKQRPDIEKS